ncbi:hypothetical protein L195_g050344 [Trifolium pratense]|uniref:Uncharacterized protein n=1 Tax=Trifolium pratense TaxID=57577 RepID=A0A2K3JTG5_TRIPR|nr:hypothetical protein L195_g050344 [Trifolium pratense]
MLQPPSQTIHRHSWSSCNSYFGAAWVTVENGYERKRDEQRGGDGWRCGDVAMWRWWLVTEN